MSAPVVAVDLGGTKVAAATVTAGGVVRDRAVHPTPATAGPEAVLNGVAEAVRGIAPDGVSAVGVGAAGSIDPRTGVVLAATDSIEGWAGTDIRTGIAARLDLPTGRVAVENDVHAHARGEAILGAGSGHEVVLMLAVGTGVGGALVSAGAVLRGATGQAGAVAHIPVPGAEGMRCTCGGIGHLEAIAAGPALIRMWHDQAGEPIVHGSEVAAHARNGDAVAVAVMATAGTALGTAIAGLTSTLDPAVVVIGGGLTHPLSEVWWKAVTAAARAQLTDAHRDIPIVPAALGADAALVGAGLRAHRTLAQEGAPT